MSKESLLDLIYNLKAGCIANEWRIMVETGLSPAEYNCIAALNPQEKISGSDLSQKMTLSPSRASRILDKMVKNGYLLRENDALDRRKCTITLADKGIEIKKKINKIKNKCEQKIREHLTEHEITVLTTSLKKIIDAF
ncbi:MAG: MarR family winged helix-turn-helix transcriptional regulator [Acidobacteria bacterium]|jgi:DNA-binding MarR family transcriptional regulator|nr:MarR family winged helix-turn-helix transcriptional regulator [Acidobacteriota bacterium]